MIDLRSDTVTQPTSAMWDAMRAAPLGDDVLGDEPSVQALEAKVADLLGKEAALFTPSGTMANQLAIRGACQPGDEIITHRESHIIHYETGGPAALSGCMIAGVDGEGGLFTADDVKAALRTEDIHDPCSRMVSVENTHNRGGGCPWPVQSGGSNGNRIPISPQPSLFQCTHSQPLVHSVLPSSALDPSWST